MTERAIVGTVYLIHFDAPFKHARHYVGWARRIEARIEHHRAGDGARLMRAVTQAGIDWRVVCTWKADRNFERKLKNRHGSSRFCPVCQAERTPSADDSHILSQTG